MEIIKSIILLIMLLNPFLLIIYFTEVLPKISSRQFLSVLIKSGVVSSCIFIMFAIMGDIIFTQLMQAKFASLQVFGGIIFLIIGIQFVFKGTSAIEGLRGEPKNLAGAIIMPIMIGPGTISVSIIIGKKLSYAGSAISIVSAIFITSSIMYLLKVIYDYVKPKHEESVEKYIEIMGRIVPLVIGIFSIEMIFQGTLSWFKG